MIVRTAVVMVALWCWLVCCLGSVLCVPLSSCLGALERSGLPSILITTNLKLWGFFSSG